MRKTEQLASTNACAEGLFPGDPPLRAVRIFEAIARLGSLSGAAEELAISPSAVSHQLRLLENFLQQPLMQRQGRRLILSNAGREYYRSIRSAFTVLRQATGHLLEQGNSRQVTISLIPLFGMSWFIPRLPQFANKHSPVEINVVYANHRNYLSDASDLSIRFGSGQWTGYNAEKLISGKMIPVASRDFIRLRGYIDTPELLAQTPLVHDEERASWQQWFARRAIRNFRRDGPLFEDGLLTLAAVRAGLGCALMREPMIADYLKSGELVKLFDDAVDDGRDYYLCVRQDMELSEEAKLLQQWLHNEARQ
ncbi:LysR substrate-binding domain-containing protein [Pantoea sp. App145]|uniref:LysR substrate-binding domain-containing protein n=1 Tax=Pantoea sp. App145 TaxID=3071567 RepID=UPI003A812F5B